MFTMLQQLTEAVSKTEQRKLMKEWRELSTEMELFGLLAKKMGARVKEIETTLLPIVKAAENQKEVIDNAIVEYKTRSGSTTYPYSAMWEEALKIATEDQKALLEKFKKSVEKVGAASESLSVCDPKMEKALAGISAKSSIEEIKARVVKIVKLPDDQSLEEGYVLDHVRSAIKAIKEIFKEVMPAVKKASTSADKLLAIATQK